MPDDLLTWLREQIAETEERARTSRPFVEGYLANDDAWHSFTCGYRVGGGLDDECTCGVPAAVLAQCEAHTAILALHGPWAGNPRLKHCKTCAGDPSGWPCDTLKALALAYQHRPGYREEWKP